MVTNIDRYVLSSCIRVFGAVMVLVMSLLTLEHVPRLLELSRFTGNPLEVVALTILGLLPEYAGIGIIVGLYLAFASAIRKMSLRGELEAIESFGIRPLRWMRMKIAFAFIGAAFLFLNEGWLAPIGEKSVAQISEKLKRGEFGIRFPARAFHDLGEGRILYFDNISKSGNRMSGIYLQDRRDTYSAAHGSLQLGGLGGLDILLLDGQILERDSGRIASFDELQFRTPGPQRHRQVSDGLASQPLHVLWMSNNVEYQSAAFARLLSVALSLMTPWIAYLFSRPPKRSASAIGFLSGFVVLILLLKSITIVGSGPIGTPSLASLILLSFWAGILFGIQRWESVTGVGPIDRFALKLSRNSPG